MAAKKAVKKKTTKVVKKKSTVSRKSAVVAAKKAQKRFGNWTPKSGTWQKGGKEYSKLLGHFGIAVASAHYRMKSSA